jgi:catechol 2,3-dioxygenase
MIQANKLGHIVLRVRDAQKSKEFYMRTLGLKLATEDLTRGAVFLSFGEQHHDLALFEPATREAADASHSGLHHSAWRVDSFEDLQAAHRELKAMGVSVESTVEHNVTRSVYFKDPDGNRVELYCDMVEDGFASMQRLGARREDMDIETGTTTRGVGSSVVGPHSAKGA